MDITMDRCPDETLDELSTLPNIDSTHDCQIICDSVFKDLCNSYIYYLRTRTCKVLKDTHESYLYKCGTVGASEDRVLNCLQDDAMYPNKCKNMIEGECTYYGEVLATIYNVLEPSECFMANEVLHGNYYVHKDTTQ